MISDYDKFDYDYKTYWKERNYENLSERLALKKLLLKQKGRFFLDIGGSYGRLLETYYDKYEIPVILDYSLKTLQNNAEVIRKDFPRTLLIAANVYAMPFKENVFDGSIMIRVLHHIQNPDLYLKELARIMNGKSVYLQEFANKLHIKAALRAVIRGQFGFFTPKPYQQPTAGNFEGSEGQETVFLNFHTRYLISLLKEKGFSIKDKVGTSFLRIGFVKRNIPMRILMILESILQKFFSWANISPSIIIKTTTDKRKLDNSKLTALEDILLCPSCKNNLVFKENLAECRNCKRKYQKKKGIWDMRINSDEA